MQEFRFIETIRRMFDRVPGNGIDGIGDDCAVMPLGDGQSLVFTTDLLVEGIHFLRAAISPRELGRKSLAVNLSDVAAMGAKPVATLLSLAVPGDISQPWLEEFMAGYRDLSAEFSVALIGGDTSLAQRDLVINVTAIGHVADGQIKRRGGATPGDVIAVTGTLGESAAGLKDILAGNTDTPYAHIHRNPEPQVDEGIWLGGRPEVHAMMDISDGVASDIRHIMERSGVGAQIATDRIPTPVDIRTAATGGEDYRLLLTVGVDEADKLCRDFESRFGRPLYAIGRITDAGRLEWLKAGETLDVDWQGYRHDGQPDAE